MGPLFCVTLKGTMYTGNFYIYVKEFLLETWRPGDIVIMDNLSSHKSKRVLEFTETVGARVDF